MNVHGVNLLVTEMKVHGVYWITVIFPASLGLLTIVWAEGLFLCTACEQAITKSTENDSRPCRVCEIKMCMRIRLLKCLSLTCNALCLVSKTTCFWLWRDLLAIYYVFVHVFPIIFCLPTYQLALLAGSS